MKNLRSVDCCARCKHYEQEITYSSFIGDSFCTHSTYYGHTREEKKVEPFHICDLFEPKESSNHI